MLVDYRKQYIETGMIFVPRILPPETTGRMRMICEHCHSQWRVREESDAQAAGEKADAVVMRHLTEPTWFDAQHRPWLAELLDLVADPHILDIVREVFDDEVLFRTTSLFFNPLLTSTEGNWHRDTQFSHKDEAREKEVILNAAQQLREAGRVSNIQLQIALVPSDDSEFVPGSHLRWDTDQEYAIRLADGQRQNQSNLVPGAVRTHQEPGDAAAFNPLGLHRGRYHADRYRRTLMLTYTAASRPVPKLDTFNRQPWCLQPDYLDGVKPATHAFFEQFIDRFRDAWLEHEAGERPADEAKKR